MCSPIRCDTCGKVTWTGCGQHIEEARPVRSRRALHLRRLRSPIDQAGRCRLSEAIGKYRLTQGSSGDISMNIQAPLPQPISHRDGHPHINPGCITTSELCPRFPRWKVTFAGLKNHFGRRTIMAS